MVIFEVDSHQYDRLPAFVVARSLFRLLPLFLIPFLLPEGSPDNPPSRKFEKAHRQPNQNEEEESELIVFNNVDEL